MKIEEKDSSYTHDYIFDEDRRKDKIISKQNIKTEFQDDNYSFDEDESFFENKHHI